MECYNLSDFWDVYGECENYNVLRGHKNAVLDLQYSEDGLYVLLLSILSAVRVACSSRGFSL